MSYGSPGKMPKSLDMDRTSEAGAAPAAIPLVPPPVSRWQMMRFPRHQAKPMIMNQPTMIHAMTNRKGIKTIPSLKVSFWV